MNKLTKRLALFFLSLIAGSVTFFSCTDVDKTLGMGLVPDDERREFKVDTIFPKAYTLVMDTIYTSSTRTFMVGSYYDPMFGVVNSGSAFQVLPAYDSMSFGTNPTYESCIMRLTLNKGPVGDENIAQKISVYELTERIYYDSLYYANTSTSSMIGGTPIATTTYSGEDTLNIELGPAFANRILNAPMDKMAYNRDTIFNSPFFDYIKGFYVTVEPVTGGATGRMNFFNAEANVYLTYSNIDSANLTSLLDNVASYDYNNSGAVASYHAQFNAIEHDYSKATSPDAIPAHKLRDTTAAGLDNLLYLQGLFGAIPYIKVEANSLESWLQNINLTPSQAAIIRAELIVELEEHSNFDITQYPSLLGAFTRLNLLTSYNYYYGQYLYVAGCLSSFYYGLSSFDGRLNATHKRYSFNITHEITERLRNNTDLEFYLAPYASSDGDASYNALLHFIKPSQNYAYKAVMKGPTHPTNPPMLVITYATQSY